VSSDIGTISDVRHSVNTRADFLKGGGGTEIQLHHNSFIIYERITQSRALKPVIPMLKKFICFRQSS